MGDVNWDAIGDPIPGGILRELDAAQRKEIFSALSQAVAENNPEAAELVEQLIADMKEQDVGYHELIAVREALDIYDFSTADASLEKAMTITPPNGDTR